jgi:prepilin-type N-terminal cleavage/methylation domain-containing protein
MKNYLKSNSAISPTDAFMDDKSYKAGPHKGLTMMEMIISLAIMAVIFAAILPQFKNIQNSWASKQTNAETLQNGRILISHLNRNLAKAARITAVSDPCDTTGYIEFEGNDATTYRYEIGADNIVEFGPVGNLADLAGPVSRLQFTCYDDQDFVNPITDVESIRLVKVETMLANSGPGQDKTFTASAYLRTNANSSGIDVQQVVGSEFLFDAGTGEKPAFCQIDATHYLCVYAGPGWDGWAVVLMVNPTDWTVTKGPSFEFDADSGEAPALSQIDDTHYLCTYIGWEGATAIVLTVNPADWTITGVTPFVFDLGNGVDSELCQIDATHYLCVYEGKFNAGWAVVLTVDTGNWTITQEAPLEFDALKGMSPALSRIDVDDYLCAYRGSGDDGYAVILTVDSGDFSITKGTPFEFDTTKGYGPTLSMIDASHYFCAYQGANDDCWVSVLTVNTINKTITEETEFEFDTKKGSDPVLSKEDDDYYLCVYGGNAADGTAIVLKVDSTDWTISAGQPVEFDNTCKLPDLIKVGENHHLCAYGGSTMSGWAVIFSVGGELRP